MTNSSLQYVRDEIEEMYRIVAVVSLPQTAFVATGAGVKSSVLFLKKLSQEQTEAIQNRRTALQDKLKDQYDFKAQLREINTEKKKHLKALTGLDNPNGLTGKALKESSEYKIWSKEVKATYKERAEALKEQLVEQYAERRKMIMDDYPIFMAIAEEIGYDSTGKPTATNELDYIGSELARFITAIENGEDHFFGVVHEGGKNKDLRLTILGGLCLL